MSRIAVEDSPMPTPAGLREKLNEASLFCEPCRHCGDPILGRSPNAMYCSVQCRLAAQVDRRRKQNRNKDGRRDGKRRRYCFNCEALFQATRSDAQFCSAKCRKRWQRSLA
jgi:hypothetical protein